MELTLLITEIKINITYGENSAWRNFLAVELLEAKFPAAKLPEATKFLTAKLTRTQCNMHL